MALSTAHTGETGTQSKKTQLLLLITVMIWPLHLVKVCVGSDIIIRFSGLSNRSPCVTSFCKPAAENRWNVQIEPRTNMKYTNRSTVSFCLFVCCPPHNSDSNWCQILQKAQGSSNIINVQGAFRLRDTWPTGLCSFCLSVNERLITYRYPAVRGNISSLKREQEKLARIFFHLLNMVGGESWAWLSQQLEIKGRVLFRAYIRSVVFLFFQSNKL